MKTIFPFVTVESSRRRPVLAVEIRNEPDASPADAARARNYFLNEIIVETPPEAFYLLVVPTYFFLWKPGAAPNALPDWQAEWKSALRSYLGRSGDSAWPGSDIMRLILPFWLESVMQSPEPPQGGPAEQMLVDTGLYERMKEGSLRFRKEEDEL